MTVDNLKQAMEAHVASLNTPEANERHAKSQFKYFEFVKPTYIENWPKALADLSIEQIDIPLTIDEARALGSNIAEYGEAFGPVQSIKAIEHRVNEAVKQFPNGAFIRLGSRSPKDSWRREPTMRVLSVDRITRDSSPLRFMLDCSERMSDDLRLAAQNDYAPHIFVRKWINLEKWQEFRCFVKDGELVGISQYYYDQFFPVISQEADSIEWAIKAWCDSYFVNASHLRDVVFDVVVSMRGSGAIRQWGVRLLEINPFFNMTDPCLFSWDKPNDFDGSFRYVKQEDTPTR